MHPSDLAAVVDRELRRLPMLRAPQTLLPRVLAAVQKWSRRPWYARTWFTWPTGLQAASVVTLLLLAAGGAALLPRAQAVALDATSGVSVGLMKDVAGAVQRAEVTATAIRVLWRALLEPFVAYAFALVVLMCLACAAFGAALNRVVFVKDGRT
jgi:hypothetical protein